MSPVSAPPLKLMSTPPTTSVKLPVMFGPNITGRLFCDTNEAGNGIVFRGEKAFSYATGTEAYTYAVYKPSSESNRRATVDLNANNSHAAYENAETVQPASMSALILIKL